MKTILHISAVILFLISCQNRTETVKEINSDSNNRGFELSSSLIDSFYRDDRLYPENPDFEYYEKLHYAVDLNNNGKLDSIFLNRLKGWENDPGEFQQIKIKTDEGLVWTETNFGGWVKFDNNYVVPDSIKKINQIDSDLILITDFAETKIIGLFGWVYASEPGLLTFIEFSTGHPRLMFNQNLDLLRIDGNRIMTTYDENKCWIELNENKLTMICE
jgi:hypothetical protein